MNILFATAEAVPFCKTGGLGDVCGSLPRELAQLGHRPVVVLPAFRQVFEAGLPIEPTGVYFTVPIGQKQVEGQFLRSHLPDSDVPVFFIDQPDYYDREQLYGNGSEDYKDNCERFTFYCQAVLKAITLLDLGTQLVHCHDWCAGLIPAYVRTMLAERPPYDQLATVFTIHNLAHQGNFWHWDMALTGIDWKHFNWREMEFYGNLSLMKSGITFADTISTVSPTYAQEILRAPLGCGLEGALQHRRDDLVGIINGVDTSQWNPQADPFLDNAAFDNPTSGYQGYDVKSYQQGKAACKAALQEEMGLPLKPDVPLLAMVGRLADQKGFDLIARVMHGWATEPKSAKEIPKSAKEINAQWVILGTGEAKYHHVLSQLAAEHPERVAVRLEFSNALAHRIEAGADIFLMPSQYEPCGLNQLYSLKYGTVPVVRSTGGLADTVIDASEATLADGTATGFAFAEYTSLALSGAIDRAIQAFSDKAVWEQLVTTGMMQDWSWLHSAREYAEMYQQTVEHARREVLQ